MYVAVGVIKHVKETDGEVTDSELVQVVFLEADSEKALYQTMCETELEYRSRTDEEVLYSELEDLHDVIYPQLSWQKVYSDAEEIKVTDASCKIRETDTWKSYIRFGPVNALRRVEDVLKDEIQEKLRLLDVLTGGADENIIKTA